jgi:hypothetical protein
MQQILRWVKTHPTRLASFPLRGEDDRGGENLWIPACAGMTISPSPFPTSRDSHQGRGKQ